MGSQFIRTCVHAINSHNSKHYFHQVVTIVLLISKRYVCVTIIGLLMEKLFFFKSLLENQYRVEFSQLSDSSYNKSNNMHRTNEVLVLCH